MLHAAVLLFAEHGIGGTSLQMIADAIGVTKAAVYHQYKAKEEIVRAIAALVVAGMEAALAAAEAERSRGKRRQVLIEQLIELAVRRREMAGVLQQDPVMLRHFEEDSEFNSVLARVGRVLMEEATTPAAKVRAALVTSAIAGAVIQPITRELEDEQLIGLLGQQLNGLYTAR